MAEMQEVPKSEPRGKRWYLIDGQMTHRCSKPGIVGTLKREGDKISVCSLCGAKLPLDLFSELGL